MEEKYKALLKEALLIREKAYTPYSHYKVGVALLCKSGKVYVGCNIESGAFSPTSCAERVAFFDAVKQGEREFEAMVVVAGTDGDKNLKNASPCGVCRQVMAEFCKDDFKVILPKIHITGDISASQYEVINEKVYSLDELIPFRFDYEEFK